MFPESFPYSYRMLDRSDPIAAYPLNSYTNVVTAMERIKKVLA